MAQPFRGSRGISSMYVQAIEQKSNPRATESLSHFMLNVIVAVLKTAQFIVNSSNYTHI